MQRLRPDFARYLCDAVQVFKELTGNRGGGSGGGGSAERSNLDRGRGLAKFAARIAAETVAGYALWELYKTVTAA